MFAFCAFVFAVHVSFDASPLGEVVHGAEDPIGRVGPKVAAVHGVVIVVKGSIVGVAPARVVEQRVSKAVPAVGKVCLL